LWQLPVKEERSILKEAATFLESKKSKKKDTIGITSKREGRDLL
jgi:hypothetical protein